MSPVTNQHRLYFVTVGLLALWVGVWGYFIPSHVDWAIPWLVPPLHARFLGAVYFSAAVIQISTLFTRSYAEIRLPFIITSIWTGTLFLLSLFHLDQFNYHHEPDWFWFGAYIIYPLFGIYYLWQHRQESTNLPGAALPNWIRYFLVIQGLIFSTLAIALMLAPTWMSVIWPWNITPLLAQLYSAPFLAFGASSLLLRQAPTWNESKILIRGELVFTGLVLLASYLHHQLFSFNHISSWLWFIIFGSLTLLLGFITARSFSPTNKL